LLRAEAAGLDEILEDANKLARFKGRSQEYWQCGEKLAGSKVPLAKELAKIRAIWTGMRAQCQPPTRRLRRGG
jgi:hypothetical protein